MYDEPPDPEPNQCPFCDAELGYGDGCAHCAVASKLAESEHALSTLKHKLHCRARNLAWLAGGTEVAARRAEGIALLLDLAGLKLPEAYLAQAKAAMTGEYGEHQPVGKGGGNVNDEHIVERFMEFAHGEMLSAPHVFSGSILDAKPATYADQLWWGDDANGVPRIFTEAEKRLGRVRGAGCSSQWGLSLRESIESALNSEAKSASFWLEFYRDYLRPPKDLVPPEDPRFVRGGGQPKVSFVVGTEAYTAYVGKHKSEAWSNQGLGFGGDEFVVRLEDGREFFTDNNWGRGQVPPHLRKLIPSNAVFVKRETSEVSA